MAEHELTTDGKKWAELSIISPLFDSCVPLGQFDVLVSAYEDIYWLSMGDDQGADSENNAGVWYVRRERSYQEWANCGTAATLYGALELVLTHPLGLGPDGGNWSAPAC